MSSSQHRVGGVTRAAITLHMRAFAFITQTRCTRWEPVAQRFRCSRATAYRYIRAARRVRWEGLAR